LRLSLDKGYSKSGFFWSDAVSASPMNAEWHRVVAQARGLSDEARLRLFVATAQKPSDEPPVDQTAQNPFANPKWRPRLGPPDPFLNVDEVFVRQAAVGNSFRKDGTPHLWVGGFVSGDGTKTPVLRQLRVEYNHRGYLEHLPAIYRPPHGRGTVDARGAVTINGSTPPSLDSQVNVDSNRTFLLRWLSLLEGTFGEVRDKIDSLAMLFDVAAVPHEFLLWLASWFAVDLDETWDEARQRDAVRHAFARAGRRGTAGGLREALRVFAGVDAVIEEPILNAAWWILPSGSNPEAGCACHAKESAAPVAGGDSVLGFTTMLASASPQGAVLGTSATLDQSHIIDGEDFGVPLFEAIAHQVSVLVPRGLAHCEARRQLIRTVIEREKPAHVAYHLCLIEPQLRLGWQARVGMDAIVAGPTPPGKLDENFVLGVVTTGSAAGAGSPSTPERVGFIQLAS